MRLASGCREGSTTSRKKFACSKRRSRQAGAGSRSRRTRSVDALVFDLAIALDQFDDPGSGQDSTTLCAQMLTAEESVCEEVGGRSVHGADCKLVCTKPIAPQGKAAG